MLQSVRDSMGAPPRRRYWWRHRIRLEGWVKHHPPLADIGHRQGVLLRQGDIVWGAVVQANYRMFKGGLINYPGNLIYSRSEAVTAKPGILTAAARQVFDVKGHPEVGGALQYVADMLQSEMGSDTDLHVPTKLTEGIQCYVTNVLFERRHLPKGRLSHTLLPILVDPRMSAAIVVPHWHWPPELLRQSPVGVLNR